MQVGNGVGELCDCEYDLLHVYTETKGISRAELSQLHVRDNEIAARTHDPRPVTEQERVQLVATRRDA
jgi:hypothetical protein